MSSPLPLYNPPVPFLGAIGGNLRPGRMVRIQGTVPHSANRFVVNLMCGPHENHDIALHISVRFPQATVVRNTLINMCWGPEETFGHMPFSRGTGFELLVLCDPDHFKIAVNGQHFAEYIHRTPYERVTHLEISQDVVLTLIQWEGGEAGLGAPVAPGFVVPGAPIVPPPSTIGPCPPAPPYPPYGAPAGYPPPPPGHPPHPPGYPAPPPGCPPPPPGYLPQPPGYNHYSPYKSSGGLLGKAKAAIAGTLGTGSGHGPGMGTALGAGLAGAAVTGHLSPKKALKAQKKARKRALKYGLPIAGIAGVGLGAYAANKAFHGFHSSSSSSSSSSEEE